jgi:hypothetical protein
MGKIFQLIIGTDSGSIGGRNKVEKIQNDFGVPIDKAIEKARRFDGMRLKDIGIVMNVNITCQKDIEDLRDALLILKYTFKE